MKPLEGSFAKSYKRDKGTLVNYNKDYVMTQIFLQSFGRRIAQAKKIHHASDYDDFYLFPKEKAEK